MKNYLINILCLRCIKVVLMALALQSLAVNALAKPVVIGYIPAFGAMKATVDTTDLSLVTHINISFLNPDASGALLKNDSMLCMPDSAGVGTTASNLRYVINKAQQAGVKVLVSVAGGVIPACSGDWSVLLRPVNRQVLVDGLIKFVDDFKLDGLDIDLEGEVLTKIDKAGDYTPFIQALSEQLKTRNKLLTCATASYEGGMIPVSSIPYFDFVNIMSYDSIGPSWGIPGVEHSTYAQAVNDVSLWKARGLSQEKLVLGVPFYGYGFGTYAANYTFKDIVTKLGSEHSDKDLIGSACANCNYVTYNGISTIKNKTRLALQNGAGIMIWELSQDGVGAFSLLKTINVEMQLSASSTSSANSSSSSNASSITSSSSTSSSAVSSQVAVASSASATSNPNPIKNSGGAFDFGGLLLLIVSVFALRVTAKNIEIFK